MIGDAPRYTIEGRFVRDRETGEHLGPFNNWSEQCAQAAALNSSRAVETPAPPRCDCRERMERYRVALNKIRRHSECEYARRTADDALAGSAADG